MKRIVWVLLAVVFALCLSGCTGSERTDMVFHFGEKRAESALFYHRGAEGMEYEPLEAEKLGSLVEAINKLPYRTHFAHTDYYWGGRFGVEIAFTDGTFWCYDGTKLKLRSCSMTESTDSQYDISGDFVEVTDGNFWVLMHSEFFECIEPYDMPVGW